MRRRFAAAGAIAFATLLASSEPPSEFRIFAAGENVIHDTVYVFDAKAAASVIAAFEKHGADMMLDLEHLSVEDAETSANFDPDARGWCRLELRGGELWATQVRWTTDGEARLREGRQRYISPVFAYDKGSKRILKVINIALTAMPATDSLDPLVAASQGASQNENFAALNEQLRERYPSDPSQPYPFCIVDIFETTVVYEYDGGTWEVAYSFNGKAATLGATPVQVKRQYVAASLNGGEEQIMTAEQLAALAEALGLGADANVEDVLAAVAGMVKKVQDAANGTPPADDAAAAAADKPAETDAPPMAASKRLSTGVRKLARLAGKGEIGELVAEIETWRTSHLDLETQRASLATERATLESTERRKLVGELVKLNAETPATAWASDTSGVPDGKTPVVRLANEPIAELRGRVAKLAAAGPGRRETPRVPAGGGSDAELTPEQLKICADTGCDPKVFASLRKQNPALTVRS